MHLPGMFPEYINVGWFLLSQTLITSLISLLLFIIFILIFNFVKNKNSESLFVVIVEMSIEWMNKFFWSVSEKVPFSVKIYVLFLFVYILWNNILWLFFDVFATVVPVLHEYVRPVTTDIIFNWMLAVFGVLWAIVYWFKMQKLHFVEKYFPLKWVGISWNKPQWNLFKTLLWVIVKIFDVLIWLFIGFLEFVWEFTKILSLTLRLFWNIFAWVVLLTLIVYATISIAKVPFLAPLLVVAMELLVWFLQAFVFALLVMVYFKLAEESH